MKNMLDGDLLWRYTQLSRVERHELAKKIGTTQDQVGADVGDSLVLNPSSYCVAR